MYVKDCITMNEKNLTGRFHNVNKWVISEISSNSQEGILKAQLQTKEGIWINCFNKTL